MARKKTDSVGLRLRFGEALRRRIERAANNNRRSMNAEIVYRLTQSFAREDQEAMIEAAVGRALSKAERAVEKAGEKAAQADFKDFFKPEGGDK
jgi:hypothetical protein